MFKDHTAIHPWIQVKKNFNIMQIMLISFYCQMYNIAQFVPIFLKGPEKLQIGFAAPAGAIHLVQGADNFIFLF